MKKIMILGAGIYQVPLILKAKEMGLSTLVVSYPGNYPGFALADECLYLDTRDSDGILRAAIEKKIDGICTTGTDVAICTLGYVADTLHLPGVSQTSAAVVTDKYRMRQAFLQGRGTTVPFRRAASLEDARKAFSELGAPVMVKAVDSSGSRGISRVSSPEELENACFNAVGVTRTPYLLVEKCIPGHEIGVDGFIMDGKIQLLLPHEKFTVTSGNTTLPGGHAFPFQASPALLSAIEREISLAVEAAGLDCCAFNSDVIISEDQPYVIEIGARCGATCIPELISRHCHFDYYRKILECALGFHPDFTFHSPAPCMAKLLFSPVDGQITSIDQEALHALQNSGYEFSLDYPAGAAVQGVRNGTDRIGQLIMNTDRESELDSILSRLYQAIEVDGVTLSDLWLAKSAERRLS